MDDRSRAYDTSTVIFSPQGDIIQLEYARKAAEKGATALGIRLKEFIVLAGIRKETELIEAPTKIHKIDMHIAATAAGLQADTSALVRRARILAQIHRLTYDDEITTATLATQIGEFLANYTLVGGLRPFGTALLVGGIPNATAELYLVDPGGAIFKCKAIAIGQNADAVNNILKESHTPDLSRKKAMEIAKDALSQYIVDKEQETIDIDIIDASGIVQAE